MAFLFRRSGRTSFVCGSFLALMLTLLLLALPVNAGAQTASQTITFPNPGTQTYGVAPVTLRASASSRLPVSYKVISGPATVIGAKLTITGAGLVAVEAAQTGNSSYAAAAPVNGTLTVNKAVLTLTANNVTKVYSAANPSLTYTIKGYVNGDTNTVVSGTAPLATTATAASAVGTYPITFSTKSLVASNYSFNYISGKLTVTAAPSAANLGLAGLVGAFTDSNGSVIEPIAIGAFASVFVVPSGATQLQLGINDDIFYDNKGTGFVVAVNGMNVTVLPTSMPWKWVAGGLNSSYQWGRSDGTNPIVALRGLKNGEGVNIAYQSGTVTPGGFPYGDASGDQGWITGTGGGNSGKHFPSFYMAATDYSFTYANGIPTVTASVPTITTLSPSPATAGGAVSSLTINGTNFTPAAAAKWGSTALTTTYVSATKLTAAVPASLIATAGTAKVTVTTTGGTSAAATFSIK